MRDWVFFSIQAQFISIWDFEIVKWMVLKINFEVKELSEEGIAT